MEGRFSGIVLLLLLLCVGARECKGEGSMDGRQLSSTDRVWRSACCMFYRLRPLLGGEHSESKSSRGAFGGLVFVVEDIGICLSRLLGPPGWSWGVGHGSHVFG